MHARLHTKFLLQMPLAEEVGVHEPISMIIVRVVVSGFTTVPKKRSVDQNVF